MTAFRVFPRNTDNGDLLARQRTRRSCQLSVGDLNFRSSRPSAMKHLRSLTLYERNWFSKGNAWLVTLSNFTPYEFIFVRMCLHSYDDIQNRLYFKRIPSAEIQRCMKPPRSSCVIIGRTIRLDSAEILAFFLSLLMKYHDNEALSLSFSLQIVIIMKLNSWRGDRTLEKRCWERSETLL